MDTIELGCENQSALAALKDNMRDQCDRIEKLSFSSASRRGYKGNLAIVKEEARFCLFWESRHRNRPFFLFQFHASDFKSVEDMCNHLHQLWAPHFGCALDARLMRFDICIDLLLPIETIDRALQQPRARVLSKYRSGSHGIIIGKHPKETAIYEREMKPEEVDFVPEGGIAFDEKEKLVGTRIEVRHWGDRIPIPSLRHLDKLYEIRPFDHISLRPIDNALITKVKDVRTKKNISAYLYRVQEVGAHQARKEFNVGGNFEKTVGRFLKPLSGIDLHQIYLTRLNRIVNASPLATLSSGEASIAQIEIRE